MTELVNDDCYWCESNLTRPITSFPVNPFRWTDSEQSVICLFHPANFDARTMSPTGETAYHQTMEEVHDIIIAEHYKRKAQLNKEPLHAVEDNVVKVAKKAQRTSQAAAQAILPKTGTIRARVYNFFVNRQAIGATDDEAQDFLKIDGNTFRPTRKSLVDDGYLIDSGTTRKNENGHECIVWIDRSTWLKGELF